MTNPEPSTLPTLAGTLFRHKYGGFYRYLALARHTGSGGLLVVHEHVWPFEPGMCLARPAEEWLDGRFERVGEDVLRQAMREDRSQAQQAVAARKADASNSASA